MVMTANAGGEGGAVPHNLSSNLSQRVNKNAYHLLEDDEPTE